MTLSTTTRAGRSVLPTAIALAGTALLVALAVMSVMPAWSMLALPVVLATSELSPALLVITLAWIAVARWLLAARVTPRTAATILLVLAAMIFVRPLAQYGDVQRRAFDALWNYERHDGGILEITYDDVPSAPHVREQIVRYSAGDGTPLTMRVYRDPAQGRRPIVVVLYGGAWRGGDATQGAGVSRALAGEGYVVAAIDYRHAPRFVFPAQLEDVRRSIALVRDSASSWKGDTAHLALLGRSAGGHLAELAAFAPGDRPVQAVVGIYAPWNLAEGYRDVPVPDPIGVRGVIGNFIGGSPAQQPARYRDASPSSYVRPGLPPTLLIFGSRDHLVKPEFNRQAAAALRAAGDSVVAVEIPWAEHAFDLVPSGLGGRLAYASIVLFLHEKLDSGAPITFP